MASLQEATIRSLLEEVQAGRGDKAYHALLEGQVQLDWFDSPNREILFFALQQQGLFTPYDLAEHFKAHTRILEHIAKLHNELLDEYPGAFYTYLPNLYPDYQNRQLNRQLSELAALAPHMSYEEKVGKLMLIKQGLDLGVLQSDLVSAEEASQRAIAVVDMLQRGEKDKFIVPTGYSLLDSRLDGIMRGDVMCLIAPTGVGKSAFASGVIQHNARRGNVCLVESLEMTSEVWAMRASASNLSINQKALIRQTASPTEYEAFKDDLANMGGLPIEFNRKSRVTLEDIARHIAYVKNKYGRIDLLVVDYGRLVNHPNSNPVIQANEIAIGLKYLANDTVNDDDSKLAVFVVWDMPKKDNAPDFMPNKSDAMYGGVYTFADVFSLTFPFAYKDSHRSRIEYYAKQLGYDEWEVDDAFLSEEGRTRAWCKIVKARHSLDNELFTGFTYKGEYTRWEIEENG